MRSRCRASRVNPAPVRAQAPGSQPLLLVVAPGQVPPQRLLRPLHPAPGSVPRPSLRLKLTVPHQHEGCKGGPSPGRAEQPRRDALPERPIGKAQQGEAGRGVLSPGPPKAGHGGHRSSSRGKSSRAHSVSRSMRPSVGLSARRNSLPSPEAPTKPMTTVVRMMTSSGRAREKHRPNRFRNRPRHRVGGPRHRVRDRAPQGAAEGEASVGGRPRGGDDGQERAAADGGPAQAGPRRGKGTRRPRLPGMSDVPYARWRSRLGPYRWPERKPLAGCAGLCGFRAGASASARSARSMLSVR